MGRACTICTHTYRAAIDAALEAGHSFRDIARNHEISKTSLHRHWQFHTAQTRDKAASAPSRPTGTDTRSRGKWGWWVAGILGVLLLLRRPGNARFREV